MPAQSISLVCEKALQSCQPIELSKQISVACDAPGWRGQIQSRHWGIKKSKKKWAVNRKWPNDEEALGSQVEHRQLETAISVLEGCR